MVSGISIFLHDLIIYVDNNVNWKSLADYDVSSLHVADLVASSPLIIEV